MLITALPHVDSRRICSRCIPGSLALSFPCTWGQYSLRSCMFLFSLCNYANYFCAPSNLNLRGIPVCAHPVALIISSASVECPACAWTAPLYPPWAPWDWCVNGNFISTGPIVLRASSAKDVLGRVGSLTKLATEITSPVPP
jgi:hypothetical protein